MRKFSTALASACVIALATATGAMAQTSQSGLVNINVEDGTSSRFPSRSQQICDVTVAVLATDLEDGSATCRALALSGATVTPSGPDGPTRQDGLINVNLSDNTVQRSQSPPQPTSATSTCSSWQLRSCSATPRRAPPAPAPEASPSRTRLRTEEFGGRPMAALRSQRFPSRMSERNNCSVIIETPGCRGTSATSAAGRCPRRVSS